MASLFNILSIGASSAAAQRSASSTASHNLGNANTPGYARQRTSLEAALPALSAGRMLLGQGARAANTTQVRNRFLEAQSAATLSAQARSGAQADALESLSALDPSAPGSPGTALGAFFSSLRGLAQRASDPGYRQSAVASAQDLAASFNRTAASIESARGGLDANLAGRALEANDLSANVARLNMEIRTARANGSEPNDLMDARTVARDALAALTGAQPVPDGAGNISMVLPGGAALVTGDRSARLDTLPDPLNRGHTIVRLDGTAGSPPVALAAAQLGGSMRGDLDARDGALKTALDQVDQLAFDLGNALNAVHRSGVGADGSTGSDLFTIAATAAGAASTIQVSAAVAANPQSLAASTVAAGLPGGGDNAQRLIDVESASLSNGRNASATLGALVSGYGSETRSARATSDADTLLAQNVQSLREAASGVSIDDELIDLTRSQRAYEAALKVITTADEMMDSLLRLRG